MPGTRKEPGGKDGPRVLVVDDEADMRYLTRAFLQHAFPDMVVVEAKDGPSALAQLTRAPFDVLLTDYKMPGMDGFDLLRQAAAYPVRGILMTAYADKALQDRARDAGFSFLDKDGDPDNVVRAVQAVLEAGPPLGPVQP